MKKFPYGSLKVGKDADGNIWISGFADERIDESLTSLNYPFLVLREIEGTLNELQWGDIGLKRDIYIAFIGCFGRWMIDRYDSLQENWRWKTEQRKSDSDVSALNEKFYFGSWESLGTIKDALFVIDNETFKNSLGSSYKTLSEENVEKLKELLYVIASAVLESLSKTSESYDDKNTIRK